MQSGLAAIGLLIWFVLTGLLWYARPPDTLWLMGSLALGAVFCVGFLRYVKRQ
jgi:hypothetical protein